MPQLITSNLSADLVAKAEEIINNFLSENNNLIYAINPDGSTFTLEPGCTLLTVKGFRIEYGTEA